jgi:hypothetical protein
MLHAKSVVNSKTFGEKVISVLRQPLFTIPLSFPVQSNHKVDMKPVTPKTVKTTVSKKAVNQNNNHPVRKNIPYKRIPVRNTIQNKRTVLYTFTPTKNQKDFDKILFVLKACDKTNSGTEFTNILRVEQTKTGSRLIATDGKRMHVTEIGMRVKPGNYKPIVTKETIRLEKPLKNITYPNWERVVPVNVTRRGCFNIVDTGIEGKNKISESFTQMTGEKVNPDYLADLSKKQWIVYCQNEKRKAVLLKDYNAKETYAVIMPLSA